jgi:fused signal recognition particle receptor
LSALFRGKKEIDPALLEQIEEVMLASDVGPKTTSAILGRLRESLERDRLQDPDAIWSALRSEATRILALGGGPLRLSTRPTVVLMVGVNGAGKTTTIGKLATRYVTSGRKVVLAAGDTFRAAAVQQLEIWGKRVGATVIKGKEGADPGAVAFDATSIARDIGADLLLVDTAGRLHTKAPLMDEIKKVAKTIAKAMDGAPHETLLVLDATTGQNALAQAAMFKDALDLTGIVLTKLDGTAKGGIVLGICDELKVPVRYIGLGERAEDLREFDAEDFVEALLGKGDEEVAAA